MIGSIIMQINPTGATGVIDTAKHVANVVAANTTTVVTTPPKEATLSLFDLLMRGGWVMVPIAMLLLIALYVFFERLMTIMRSGKSDRNFMNNIKDFIANGNLDAAKAFCRSSNSPQARVIEKGISRIGKPMKEIEEAMQDVGKLELYKLEKNLSILSIVGRIAPMLGFIGTIIGVINIFYEIELAGAVEIRAVSEGLYQKMVSSASGLTIGVFAFVCFHSLVMQVDKIVNRIEVSSMEFLDLLNAPSKS